MSANFPPDSNPDYSIERDLGLTIKICPGCRTHNLPTSQYCYKCGLKLPEEAIVPDAAMLANPAGFWRRLFSFIIDNIFIAIITFVISSLVFAILFSIFPDLIGENTISEFTGDTFVSFAEMTLLDWLSYLGALLIDIAYWTVAIGWKGKTVGKMMLGMKVVKIDGSRVGYWRAFGRYWGYVLCYMTFGIGFLVIAFNKQKRGLHDLVCNTMVIKI